jgi:hypothetical protein
MSKLFSFSAWALLLAVVSAPAVYVFVAKPAAAFWETVMSGLLATAGALIGGVPIALWVDRHVKSKDAAQTAQEDRKREIELLELLKEELQFSLNGLARRQLSPGIVEIQPLKSELWAASAAAGKLNHIRSHRLLNRIASAYYVVNAVRDIERQAYIALRGATVTFSNGQTALQQVWADARRFDTLLEESIREAQREIDEALREKAQQAAAE